MLTTAIPISISYDGRDVTDQVETDAVVGYSLLTCPYCGTARDARFPFCCEFAAASPDPVLVPAR